ncbi:MAG: LysE family translocator [Colwellia sp.]|nr:LysE family translocator [Colwellia sp.]
MGIDVWFAFLLASSILCFTPGPTVFIVMAQSLNHGKKSVLPLVFGVLCGDIIAMTVSFIGLGALLATSAVLFSVFKWLAALYLIFLGIKAWRSEVNIEEVKTITAKKNSIFKEALIVTALNPKGIIFFISFFPLFINTQAAALPQMLVMAGSFLMVSALSASFYANFAGYLRSKVKSDKFQRTFNKVSGTMLATAGAVTASINK